jgi:hypothetical protein
MDYTSIKVGQLPTGEISGGNFIPHEVAGILKKATITDLAAFIGANDAVGFRAVSVQNGGTLPATDTQEFILVGPGTYNNVGGGSTITVTEELNALVSNGTFWFVGVEIPIDAPPGNAIWGQIIGTLSNQTDLKNILDLKADLVDGKVPASQLPSYVDDIIEVANYAALPATGETGKIYLTLDNNKIYRWSGSVYIEIAAENAVWGQIVGTLSNQTDLQSALNAKVPYTGATANVDLGTHTLSSYNLVVNHTSGSGVAAQITKGGNGEALTVVKSSGTGNAASITGGITLLSTLNLTNALADAYIASAGTWNAKQNALNGTGFVKISGTTISYDNNTYALDSAVVTLATDQTISGQKTFLNNVNIDAGINIDDAFGLYWKTNVGAIETALAGIGQSSSGLNFFTGSSLSTPKMVITSGGSIGIGTTSPSNKLSVFNTLGLPSSSVLSEAILLIQDSGSNRRLGIGSSTSGQWLQSSYPGVEGIASNLLLNPSGGSVGIGTTSPTQKLSINGNAQVDEIFIGVTSSFLSGTTNAQIGWSGGFSGLTNGSLILQSRSNVATPIIFATETTEKMRITSGGNVLIGTTTDAGNRLEVTGTGNNWAGSFTGSTTTGQSYGAIVRGGTNSSDVAFSVNNAANSTTYFRVRGDGNVGIGTTSPVQKLHVEGSTAVGTTGTEDILILGRALGGGVSFQQAASFKLGRYQNAGGNFESYTRLDFALRDNSAASNYNTNTTVMTLTNAGNVGIGTTSPSYTLHVNGSVAGTSAYNNLSDKRYKKDILPIENALDKILALNGVTFNWDKEATDMNLDDNNHIGLLAQDVEEILPQAVTTGMDENETKSVAYTDIVPVLIEAIKELKAEIEILKNK